MARPGFVGLAVVVGVLSAFAHGCAQQGKADPSGRQQEERASSAARIVCLEADQEASHSRKDTETLYDGALTRVLTPRVAAQTDGAHIQVENRLGEDTTYTSKQINEQDSQVFASDQVQKGMSHHVETFAPGKVKIVCDSTTPQDGSTRTYANFEVVEGTSGYKSLELECNPGAVPMGGQSGFSGTPKDEPEQINHRDPTEWVEEHSPNTLEKGDVVEAAGYPGDADPPVRVVRNGKVVATFEIDVEFYDSGFFQSYWRNGYCAGQF